MHLIRSNYSNNSIALIQWAYENKLEDVTVVYVDTGWAAEGWLDYVAQTETFVKSLGFAVQHLKSPMPFEDLMEMKKGFPTRRYQWCSLHLKGIPFIRFADEVDPDNQATVLIARHGVDAEGNQIPETIEGCEYHGERRVWHPFYNYDTQQIKNLLDRADFTAIHERSLECSPCINSTINELQHLAPCDIEKIEELEEDLETHLFSPDDCDGAEGILDVIQWARQANENDLDLKFGCSASFGCGS